MRAAAERLLIVCLTSAFFLCTDTNATADVSNNNGGYDGREDGASSSPPPEPFYHPRFELDRSLTSGEETFRAHDKERKRRRREMCSREGGGVNVADDGRLEKMSKELASQLRMDGGKSMVEDDDESDTKLSSSFTPVVGLSPDILVEIAPLANPHGINHTTAVDRSTLAFVQNSATSGSADASYFLGIFHLYGIESLLTPDAARAEGWFRTAAEGGHIDAMCALGVLLYRGSSGVDSSSGESGARTHDDSAPKASDKATKKSRKEEAVRWFRRASHAQHARGHWLLGQAVYEGHARDPEGVDRRETNATTLEGLTEKDGGEDGISKESAKMEAQARPDFADAARLFRLAAEADVPEAVHHLALMHEYGLIPPDTASTDERAAPAEEQDTVALQLEIKARNFRLAADLYRRAMRMGHVESTYHLGLMHAYGRDPGFPQDQVRAVELFRSCAVTGPRPHAGCMRYLGVLLANGYGGISGGVGGGGGGRAPSNVRGALAWFERCVEVGIPVVREECRADAERLRDALGKVAKIRAITGADEKTDQPKPVSRSWQIDSR